jgi:protein-S-isoprenylcysteine O-methyltransferase Ste14
MPWYRPAERAPTTWLVMKTMVYLVVLWGVCLYLLPRAIVRWQHHVDLQALFFEPQQAIGIGVMALASTISFWSAILLAVAGRGTPARVDAPRHLVITGPYAWVRNPMVVCGLAQGFAVSLYTGSVLILLLVMGAGVLWHLIRRKDEEKDLQRVFGRNYELYRRSVRCWMPQRRRWAPAEPDAAISAQTLRQEMGRQRRRRRR